MNGLNDKVALVTGASRGLGRNAALHLARNGAGVILTYVNNRDEAEAAASEIRALGRKAAVLRLDAGDAASFPAFAEDVKAALRATWGRETFDFLVNNAGIGARRPVAEFDEATFDALLNVQFKGVFFLTQKLLPLLADGGRIVNLSTGLARFTFPGYSAYAAAKGAVEVFTRYLAKELAPRRIAANVVAPGPIETDFTKDTIQANAAMRDGIVAQTAGGRLGLSDDIGGVVTFLCSEEGRWINGQRVEASGGLLL